MNIVSHIKDGDRFAFQQAYESNYEKLYYYILGKTKSEWLAEEATQITFIKLWQHRDRLNEELPVSLQIFRIAKTTMIDLIRKQNHLASAIGSLEKSEHHTGDDPVTASLDYKDAHRKLINAIAGMPPVRRKVFEMSRLNGMSYKEIAGALSISVKTVERHISQALKQVKPYLNSILLVWIVISNLLKKI